MEGLDVHVGLDDHNGVTLGEAVMVELSTGIKIPRILVSTRQWRRDEDEEPSRSAADLGPGATRAQSKHGDESSQVGSRRLMQPGE